MVDTKDLKSFGHCDCAGSSPASSTEISCKRLLLNPCGMFLFIHPSRICRILRPFGDVWSCALPGDAIWELEWYGVSRGAIYCALFYMGILMVVARGRAHCSAPLPGDGVWGVGVAGDAVGVDWVGDGTVLGSEGIKRDSGFSRWGWNGCQA